MEAYSYVIIRENYPALDREKVLLHNKHNPKKKYAFISKVVHKDRSESIAFIDYSNDLAALQLKAQDYISWYNNPANLYKDMQQNIRHITI